MKRRLPAVVALVGLLTVGGLGNDGCVAEIPAGDPLADDPRVPTEGEVAEIPAGTPWMQAGPDEGFGTADDVVRTDMVGDVDLVVRAGLPLIGPDIPLPAPLRSAIALGVAAPFGQGSAIPFRLVASDGTPGPRGGRPIVPPWWEGIPALVLAFADLDGDGFVGVTHRDGDTRDGALEQLELYPVGRRYAIGRHGIAEGSLSVSVGGPEGTGVALAAAVIAGAFENPNLACASCHAWPGAAAEAFLLPLVGGGDAAPEGPLAMTRLPFLPDAEVDYRDAPRGLVPAHPDARVAVQVEMAYLPDPSDPRVGEAFTLPLDGSAPSIDVARVHSGPAVRFGLVSDVDSRRFAPTPGRSVRPGLSFDGTPAPVEVLGHLELEAAEILRVVPLDMLGNVARGAGTVRLEASGEVEVVWPDADGSFATETVEVESARGAYVAVRATAPGAEGTLAVFGGDGVSILPIGPIGAAGALPTDVLLPPEPSDADAEPEGADADAEPEEAD